jgi:hypothetical protein
MFFQAVPYFFLALILIEVLAVRANAAARVHDRDHVDGRLDAPDAQCHDHHSRRGLRGRGP